MVIFNIVKPSRPNNGCGIDGLTSAASQAIFLCLSLFLASSVLLSLCFVSPAPYLLLALYLIFLFCSSYPLASNNPLIPPNTNLKPPTLLQSPPSFLITRLKTRRTEQGEQSHPVVPAIEITVVAKYISKRSFSASYQPSNRATRLSKHPTQRSSHSMH
ncbi:hypothetical protein BDV12DRAFT_65283 [Aspergillus spectabilis]